MNSDQKTGSWLIPRHNELSLFLIGSSILILLLIDAQMRFEIQRVTTGDYFIAPIPICLLFFGQGVIFTFIHLFTKSHKNSYEKFCMLCFAILVNLGTGIAASVYFIQHDGFGIFIIFPLLNLINGALLAGIVTLGLMSGSDLEHLEESIDDDDATLAQILLGLAILVITIGLCHFVFDLYWAITLSMCVAYTSNLDRLIQKLATRTKATS